MPDYDFRCSFCGQHRSVRRRMAQAGDPVTCATCGARAERVYGMAPIIFRPDGWLLSPDDPRYSHGLKDRQDRETWKHASSRTTGKER